MANWLVLGALLVTVISNLSALAQSPSSGAIAPDIASAVVQHLSLSGSADARVEMVQTTESYALATWTKDKAGGQTLLSKQGDTWSIVESGGGVMNLSLLREVGVSDNATANKLLNLEENDDHAT